MTACIPNFRLAATSKEKKIDLTFNGDGPERSADLTCGTFVQIVYKCKMGYYPCCCHRKRFIVKAMRATRHGNGERDGQGKCYIVRRQNASGSAKKESTCPSTA